MTKSEAAAAVRTRLAAKRKEAEKAWGVLETAKRKAVAAGPRAISPTSAEFKALDDAGKRYDEVAGELKRAEAVAAQLRDTGPGLTPDDHLKAATGIDRAGLMNGLRAWRAKQGIFAGIDPGERPNPEGFWDSSSWIPLIRRSDFRNAVASLSTSPIAPTHRLPSIETASGPTLSFLPRVPVTPVAGGAFDWMKETTSTTPAAETPEGTDVALASEAELVYTPQTGTCVDVDVTLPISVQLLADEGRFESFVVGRLGLAVMQRIQSQAINGLGGDALTGILSTVGLLSQPLGADKAGDAVLKAMTKVRQQTASLYEPDVLLLSPADWRGMFDDKSAVNGEYLIDPGIRRPWNIVPIPHASVPDGTALVGATAALELVVSDDVRFHITKSHGSHFTAGVADILVRFSGQFLVRCPEAWCEITSFES
jgi:HK97 family phage major capsid protein